MRHILTLAACLLLCAGLGAQEEHLRFNGIPLTRPPAKSRQNKRPLRC